MEKRVNTLWKKMLYTLLGKKQERNKQQEVKEEKTIEKSEEEIAKREEEIARRKIEDIDRLMKIITNSDNYDSDVNCKLFDLCALGMNEAKRIIQSTINYNGEIGELMVDLRRETLFIRVATIPGTGQYAPPGGDCTLTPMQYHNIAITHDLGLPGMSLKTKEEWQKVLESEAVRRALKEFDERRAERIPAHFQSIQPKIKYDMKLSLKKGFYDFIKVILERESGKYKLYFQGDGKSFKRELTSLEAAWLEHKIEKELEDTDETEASLPSYFRGFFLSCFISENGIEKVNFEHEKPLKKYDFLLFGNLAKHGGICETELAKNNVKE